MPRMLAMLLGVAAVVVTPAAWATGPSRTLDDYVLLGIDGVRLKNLATVMSGAVGVNESYGPGHSGLALGRDDVLADGTTAVADLIRAGGVTVYDVYANRLLLPNEVTVRGAGPLPPGPFPLISPLPTLPPFAPGNTSIVVQGQLALAPGAYATVTVPNGAQLDLAAGTYELQALQLGRNAQLLVHGPVTLNIQDTLRVGNASVVRPADGAGTADDVVVNVGGTVGTFGSGAEAFMTLYAPNAKLVFGRHFQGTGQFVGRSINTDHSTLFARGDCGNGVVEPGEDCEPPNVSPCDATCHLPTSTTSTTRTTTSTSTTSSSTTTTSTTTTSTTEESTTTTVATSTTTTEQVPTTTTTMPVAICGNREVEFPEECDPPGASCGPDGNGTCLDDCTCFFGGS